MKLYTDNGTFQMDAHQVEALQFLRDTPRCALFMGMATQKTITTLLYLYESIYYEAMISKVLIVAPAKVARLTWVDEVKKFHNISDMRISPVLGTPKQRLKALHADADVYILGVDNLSWLIDQYIYRRVNKYGVLTYDYKGSLPFDCLVLDESSLFKSQASARFKKLRKALELSKVEYRILLTGTPNPNDLTDLWSQLFLVDEGERLGRTWGAFIDKYFTTRGNGMVVHEYIPRKNTDRIIASKIKDVVLSIRTDDVMELPPYVFEDEIVELDGFDQDTYDYMEREFFIEFDESESTSKTGADLVGKLLQIASGALYDDDKNWHELNTAKLDRLDLLLRDQSEPVLLVYQFRHELERVLAKYPHAEILPQGAKLEDTRDRWNRGEIDILIIHPASAGHGLNLQFGGSRIIWLSPTWNLEHWEQTNARLRRRGQKDKSVRVTRILAKGTRDFDVIKRVNSKASTQEFILNQIKKLRRKYGKEI